MTNHQEAEELVDKAAEASLCRAKWSSLTTGVVQSSEVASDFHRRSILRITNLGIKKLLNRLKSKNGPFLEAESKEIPCRD